MNLTSPELSCSGTPTPSAGAWWFAAANYFRRALTQVPPPPLPLPGGGGGQQQMSRAHKGLPSPRGNRKPLENSFPRDGPLLRNQGALPWVTTNNIH
ncbi:hypothetical protein JTE90_006112 [Oedothorax gibbosus]|uniref:Uncharacterized protein n=1 Tax=Oedothorax gibbosus TaxID=931172 RepID=A0AAV6V685_9ARAC|nr:hypothetical protein JTE90_006112 [Oedothorax gibbosus]